MSRHLGLRTRVRRLEKRRASRRPRPAIVFAVEGVARDRIVALGGIAGEPCERRWGESLAALAQRARPAVRGHCVLIASYPPAALADAPEAPPPALPLPPPAAEPPPPAPPSDRTVAWAEYRKNKGY